VSIDGRAPVRVGASIGLGYEVIEHLARSNVLDVYDVWSEERACRCVAKTLRPEKSDDARARRALLAEGRLLESLRHPHIVAGYETLTRPRPVVILETLSGETLAHLIEYRPRPLSARELAFLGLQLASALGYLHRHGVLHLDLKPSNIVAEGGRAKLIDLSLARAPGRIKPGIGTWCYMAPEQARGGQAGPPADVWGIGVVLWSAVGGDTPFGDESLEYPQLEHRAPPVRSERRLPRPLAEMIDRSLEPDPALRPSLAELAAALAPVAGARG
jgi:eukaryotic-like serine/threonine-protein kinase